MEGRELVFALLGVIFVAMAFNVFFVGMGTENNLIPQGGLDMEKFNKTRELMTMTSNMRNETTFLEDVPIIGDIAAIVGNAVKAFNFLWRVPGIFTDMILQAGGYIGIPEWIFDIVSAFVWILLMFIAISFFRGYRT